MKRLKELRLKHGYTVIMMAHMLKISPTYYWQIENKDRRLYYELAKKIAQVFKLKPDDIFFEEY